MRSRIRAFVVAAVLAGGGILGGCLDQDSPSALNGLEKQISDNNQKGYQKIEEGAYEDALPFLNKAIEYVYKLDPELKDLKREVERSELIDSPFNNISWAYNELGDYAKGLDYIEKSLLILPNTDVEYVNKGNALNGLRRNEEALASYKQAVALNSRSESAIYGMGLVSYEEGDYEEALAQFKKYLELVPSDTDAAEMVIDSLLALDRDEKAVKFADSFFKKYEDSYEGYMIKGYLLEETAEFEETERFYKQAGEKFPDLPEAQLKLGELYYDNGDYDTAADHFNRLLNKFPDEPEVYTWLIWTSSAQGDLDQAEAVYAKSPDAAEIHNAMGNAYLDQGLYLESLPYFERAIKLDPADETGYIYKLKALDWGKRYYRCVEFGQKLADLAFSHPDIPWYIGQCQLELENYEEAIPYFEQAVHLNPEDYESLAQIAYAYLLLEDDAKAKEYSNRALKIYDEDSTALYVQSSLEEKQEPLGGRVRQFFLDNYLYRKSGDQLEQALEKLKQPGLSVEQIGRTINNAKLADDRFTFAIYGDAYDQMTAARDDNITYKEKGNTYYFAFDSFTETTDDQFIQLLDRIPNPEDKTLVLDLRGNGGGLSYSANAMLDVLLPDLVTSTIIYQDGYTSSYYSDASHTGFKKIYIFVDENTASAAELLTLGLKTYLNNVTVVGRDTFGKGVGQVVFEDKRNRIIVYVVNHYWNVKQNNIMNAHIKPDIYVKGNKLDDFMRAVK
ncbi:tetratricopeptide repeat protein [Paenibacillus macerans]|uniref:Tetratricopeptide repeat family protein n=1 Tax=Paenibacillus macerans TaxID=44252 RepID=A0A090ZB95_PAEMA|nr:tetratricopeptide repeat protein [Paenibacillus macerans]KFN07673.1 tetratricopeptide repeat family protein [Paenibacillus macerans]MCY7559589.1 tetratricopeptide repeat protein [Paenibacillus macerans]MEC0136616.1 tetratricopeptide repeat protein [Paenibacillus macerans]MEC0154033.1 tetratricopeptide repeat protein [Paenibacillus macerans]SUA86482.1 carboxyl-terminal protease [Paenibacillus macerans]